MRGFSRNGGDGRGRLARLADEELMQLVADADADAFELIFERHGDAAFSLAYRMCGTRVAAEDVTQEAFLAIWRMAGRYDSARGSLRTWTLGVVHNQAVDALRARGRHIQRQASVPDVPEFVEAPVRTEREAIGNVEGEILQRAVAELPDEQRQAIELAYFGGFTQSEIASMLDQPLGTIKGRMRLGLHKLRDHCQAWEAQIS